MATKIEDYLAEAEALAENAPAMMEELYEKRRAFLEDIDKKLRILKAIQNAYQPKGQSTNGERKTRAAQSGRPNEASVVRVAKAVLAQTNPTFTVQEVAQAGKWDNVGHTIRGSLDQLRAEQLIGRAGTRPPESGKGLGAYLWRVLNRDGLEERAHGDS